MRIELSADTARLAEQQARAAGFADVEAYLDGLVRHGPMETVVNGDHTPANENVGMMSPEQKQGLTEFFDRMKAMPDEPVQPQNGFGKQEHEIGANELNDQINHRDEAEVEDANVMSHDQRQALLGMLSAVDAIPCTPKTDNFSNRDHDRILYGDPKA